MPLKLTDTASRPLRQLDAFGLVGGIDGTRLPFQQPRYDPKQKRWRFRTTWQNVVVGVAGKPPVIVAIEVGRETDEVVQQVVHSMAAAGVRPPLVLCHDGLATYHGDPFLLSCLTYGYEPREVNFPWENPAEAAINELKSRWPAKCSEEHFGGAGEEAVREMQDPVRGSSFTPSPVAWRSPTHACSWPAFATSLRHVSRMGPPITDTSASPFGACPMGRRS